MTDEQRTDLIRKYFPQAEFIGETLVAVPVLNLAQAAIFMEDVHIMMSPRKKPKRKCKKRSAT